MLRRNALYKYVFFIFVIWICFQLLLKAQAYNILSSSPNFESCVSASTRSFTDSEYLNKEYIYYNCRLFLGNKTLAFYYDLDSDEVVEERIVDLSYESIGSVYPRMCVYSKADKDNIYGMCTVFISYSNFLGQYKEQFFSTPATLITDPKAIENLKKENILTHVDDLTSF